MRDAFAAKNNPPRVQLIKKTNENWFLALFFASSFRILMKNSKTRGAACVGDVNSRWNCFRWSKIVVHASRAWSRRVKENFDHLTVGRTIPYVWRTWRTTPTMNRTSILSPRQLKSILRAHQEIGWRLFAFPTRVTAANQPESLLKPGRSLS